jgi:hypothetical protein
MKELKPFASAVAVAGGSCQQAGCVLPIVVPSCGLIDNTGTTVCGTTQTMYFNHGQGRDIVLANVVDPSGNVNNSTERGQMSDGVACKLPAVNAGGQVQLGNGTDFNKQIADLMELPVDIRCETTGPDYAGCQRYTLEVSNNGNCALPMNKAATVIGFVSVVVLSINPSGTDAGITVAIDCNGTPKPSRAGCANFGIGSAHGSMGL